MPETALGNINVKAIARYTRERKKASESANISWLAVLDSTQLPVVYNNLTMSGLDDTSIGRVD